MTTIKIVARLGVAIFSALLTQMSYAVEIGEFNGTSVTLKGYIKLDTIVTRYDSGSLSSNHISRDFYVPSTTPIGGEQENATIDMHARQSRFSLATKKYVNGELLKTYLEMDFMVTPNGDERISNSYTPRMRHALLSYGNWTFGQTWSTFMNTNALPDSLDFIGNTDATIFVRQAQIRYTSKGFQFSLENPETLITPFGGGNRIVTDDNIFPDVVIRYNFKADSVSLSVAGLARQLVYNNPAENIDTSTSAFGISFSGGAAFRTGDMKFTLNTGSGMGRYIGLNIANDAVLSFDGELESIDSLGASLSYRRFWNEKWRSSIIYSLINIDNDINLTGTSVSALAKSTRVNLIYSSTPNLSFGGELTKATRELENGENGSMNRFQFSAKLAF